MSPVTFLLGKVVVMMVVPLSLPSYSYSWYDPTGDSVLVMVTEPVFWCLVHHIDWHSQCIVLIQECVKEATLGLHTGQ